MTRTVPAGQGKAPGPDHSRRPGETPGNAGKGAVMPISDPALRGGESKLPSPSAVERLRRTENTHTIPSTPSLSQKVWEKRRTVADATGLGAGITASLRNSHGPSIASPAHSDALRGISDLPAHLAPHPAIPSPLMRPLHNRIFRLRSGIHPLWVGHSARPELSRRVSRAEWVGVPALSTQNYAKASRWERVIRMPKDQLRRTLSTGEGWCEGGPRCGGRTTSRQPIAPFHSNPPRA